MARSRNSLGKNSTSNRRNVPRYRVIADELGAAIAAGDLQVGDRLPGEHELREHHKVSRHTVREALRLLEEQGLIGRHKGIGTVVISPVATPRYVQSLHSVAELLRYPSDTVMELQSVKNIAADRALATELGVALRSQWCRISIMRRETSSDHAICWTDVYVLRKYADVVDLIGPESRPIYSLIEEAYNEHIENVDIEITAGLLDEKYAAPLEVDAGGPTLNILRRYHGSKRVFEISLARHPAGRFTYNFTMQRSWQPQP